MHASFQHPGGFFGKFSPVFIPEDSLFATSLKHVTNDSSMLISDEGGSKLLL